MLDTDQLRSFIAIVDEKTIALGAYLPVGLDKPRLVAGRHLSGLDKNIADDGN